MSELYSSGVINIPNVTGNIVITAVATPAVVLSISAVYTQSGTVLNTDDLDDLKEDLVVTASYEGGTTGVVDSEDYTLSGALTVGTSTITVSYAEKTTTFSVVVTKDANGIVNGTYTNGQNSISVQDNHITFTNLATGYAQIVMPLKKSITIYTGDTVAFESHNSNYDSSYPYKTIGFDVASSSNGGGGIGWAYIANPLRQETASATKTANANVVVGYIKIQNDSSSLSGEYGFDVKLYVNDEEIF